MHKILLIEDDPAISVGIHDTLVAEKYQVKSILNGREGFVEAKSGSYDLILLDIVLPGMNGLDICRELRVEGIKIPILILTSKNEEIDKVLGLELGADDYITKPFSIRELLARIRANLRRTSDNKTGSTNKYIFGNSSINLITQQAYFNGKEIKLAHYELKLLNYLIENEGLTISREELLNNIWGYDEYPTTRTIDNHILSLRKKFEPDPANPIHFITIHKTGYKFIRN